MHTAKNGNPPYVTNKSRENTCNQYNTCNLCHRSSRHHPSCKPIVKIEAVLCIVSEPQIVLLFSDQSADFLNLFGKFVSVPRAMV